MVSITFHCYNTRYQNTTSRDISLVLRTSNRVSFPSPPFGKSCRSKSVIRVGITITLPVALSCLSLWTRAIGLGSFSFEFVIQKFNPLPHQEFAAIYSSCVSTLGDHSYTVLHSLLGYLWGIQSAQERERSSQQVGLLRA